jgi:predicted dienelactone hydrolase
MFREIFHSFICALCCIVTSAAPESANAQSLHAGVTQIAVEDAVPFDAFVVYPTEAAGESFQVGPFTIIATRDAPIAPGGRFPIVLFSHGNGRSAGTSLIHRDLITHLAREGFVVVAPHYPGTERSLVDRPRQLRKALDAVVADPRFATRADPTRISAMGFSFGAAVTLIVAGAVPDLAHLAAYCRDHAGDLRACDGVRADDADANGPRYVRSVDAMPLKALVLMEPFGALFERNGLASIDLPILLYRSLNSDLRADGNALALARALPRRPYEVTVPGGHFVFVGPCPPRLEAEVPQVCKDAPGIDRNDIHQHLRREIVDFVRGNM